MVNNKLKNIDGWFCIIDMLLFDYFLNYQNEHKLYGPLGEIGVYKGKSLIKLCQYQKEWEEIFAIDFNMNKFKNEIKSNIVSIFKDFDFSRLLLFHETSKCMSVEDLKKVNDTKFKKFTRFFHIDGSHNALDVYNDIKFADDLLDNHGILVLDDFSNALYPGIKEAFYTYQSQYNCPFKILITSPCKCYCCRPQWYEYYNDYCNNVVDYLNSFSVLPKNIVIKNINMLQNSYINIIDKPQELSDFDYDNYKVIQH